jgi:pimeloyl-ACP methyl ester carboxylesterase
LVKVPAPTITLSDGRALAYREGGDPAGAPVVWCHGGLSSSLDVENAHEAAAAAHVRLIAPDRPGIGASDRQRHHKVGASGVDVGELADALGLERFAVVGWSAGGPHALSCAAANPNRVSAVATIGGMAPLRDRADRKELGLRLDRLLIPLCRHAPWLAGLGFRATKRQKPEKAKQSLLKELSSADRRVLEPIPAARISDPYHHAMAQGPLGLVDDYRAIGVPDWGFPLSAVTAPTRVWQGTADCAVPPAIGQRLAATLPNAELELVADAGHFLVLEHGTRVFERLLDTA